MLASLLSSSVFRRFTYFKWHALRRTCGTYCSAILSIIAIGIIPLFTYTVLRGFIDALGKTRTTMIITLLSLPINVILNYLLIFGNFGFPKLGGVGAAIASTATYWCILIITVIIIQTKEPFASFNIFKQLYRPSLSSWKAFLKLGVPIGFAIF